MLYSDQLKPGVSGGILEFFTRNAVAANLMTVSYTHLTLPTKA